MDIDSSSTPVASSSTVDEKKEKDASEEQKKDEVPAGPTSAQRATALAKKKQDELLNEIASNLPEADAYVSVLAVVSLLDQGKVEEVCCSFLLLFPPFVPSLRDEGAQRRSFVS